MMVSGIPDELFPKPGQVVEKSPKSSKKYLIIGYHDKRYDPRLFEDIRDFMKVSVDGCSFALMHYPMLSWPRKSSGGISAAWSHTCPYKTDKRFLWGADECR